MKIREFIMDFNLQVIFQNMPEMTSIRKYLEKKVEELDHKFEGIESCAINFGLPYRHRYPGNIYSFVIDVSIPGMKKIQVARYPSADGAEANVFSLIREAFDDLQRQLDSRACGRKKRFALQQNPSSEKNTEPVHLSRRIRDRESLEPVFTIT